MYTAEGPDFSATRYQTVTHDRHFQKWGTDVSLGVTADTVPADDAVCTIRYASGLWTRSSPVLGWAGLIPPCHSMSLQHCGRFGKPNTYNHVHFSLLVDPNGRPRCAHFSASRQRTAWCLFRSTLDHTCMQAQHLLSTTKMCRAQQQMMGSGRGHCQIHHPTNKPTKSIPITITWLS